MELVVVRLGHRKERDKRVTTHCCLVSRALGANKIILTGDEDTELISRIRKISATWGGKFYITYSSSWRKTLQALKKQRFTIIHATMYGEPIQQNVAELSKKKKIAIVIGAEKVPAEVYHTADYNVSVTSQPHSEIAALAIILDRIQNGKSLDKKFPNPKIKITPNKRGKTVTKHKTDF